MKTLIKFLSVFKLVLMERLAYRVNFALEILSGILSSLIVILLWIAVYRYSRQPSLGGYTLAEMITYLLGGGLLNSFLLTTAENPETSQSIQDGSLSGMLVRPLSPYWVWFFRDLGSKSFLLLMGLLGYLAVFVSFRGQLVLQLQLPRLFFFLLAVALAALLQFLLFEGLSLLSFWLENTYGIRFTMRVMMEVAGGAIIPLSFFPALLQHLFLLLPFSYLYYLPMRIYLEKMSLPAAGGELLKEMVWIALLGFLNLVLWKRGIRQYVAMGD